MSIRTRLLFLVAVLAVGLFPRISGAQIVEPTDEEFLAWPSYCQAKYVMLPMGEASPWAARISKDQIAAARAQVGEGTFLAVHHSCAGSIWLNRARYEVDAVERKFMYNQVINEISFALARTPRDSILLTNMLSEMAAAAVELGKPANAIDYLQQAIDAQPNQARAYVAMALLQRKTGNLKAAKATLLKGTERLEGTSPELNYNLGLILLELKENAAAVDYAKKAYASGYPLEGLRNRLKRMGLWEESAKAPEVKAPEVKAPDVKAPEAAIR